MGGLKSLIIPVIGAGLAGAAGGIVNKWFPSLTGNTAQLVAAGAAYYLGGGDIKRAAAGALIKTGGDFIEDNVSLGFTTGTTSSGGSSTDPYA